VLYVHALDVFVRTFGKCHLETASTSNNLGTLYVRQSRYERAEALLTESLQTRRELLGPQHPDVAVSLNNLAMLYRRQGKRDVAVQLYEQALPILTRRLENDHPKTVACRRSYERCLAESRIGNPSASP
jgi:tetratricopeptide (TPR) repeat protein